MTQTQAVDWEARYRDGATAWERPGLHPSFVSWLESGVLAPCRILLPGAGRSLEPFALAEAGFDVTIVDLAESAIAAQRARLERLQVTAHVELADLLYWDPPGQFDVIYDQTCLCALPPAVVPQYIDRLHRWLRPHGRLLVMFMQTGSPGGPPFDCPLPVMRRLFPDALWGWPTSLSDRVPHPSGRTEQPVVLTRRP
jgi:SAM-dependent methyltransferase